MTDILTLHDLVPAKPPVTDGEEQLPLEGHLQQPADLLHINTTTTPVGQVCCHCCTCVRLPGLRVVLLQQWQDMMRLILILFVCLYLHVYKALA